MAGMNFSGLQVDIDLNEGNITILPASAVNPRNISSEPVAHPPPFMATVKEMCERYVARIGNIDAVAEKNPSTLKRSVQKWKTENKNIYGTKVVWNFFTYK
jgi:hypothetical protein